MVILDRTRLTDPLFSDKLRIRGDDEGVSMQDEATIRRFKGAVQLVTLHLWRIAKTTDIDACILCAKKLGMIDESTETFIRSCIDLNEQIVHDPEHAPLDTIDDDLIHEIQMCAIRLNSADPA